VIVLNEQPRGKFVDTMGDTRTALLPAGRFIGSTLTAEASIPEEPGAEKLHAGICAGAFG
jgi:hypothetical protein